MPKVPSKMAVDDPTINFQEVDSGYLTLSLRLFCGVGVALADLFHLLGQEKKDGHAKDCCLFLQHLVAALQPQLIVTQSLPSWRAAAQRSARAGAAPGTGAFTAETAYPLHKADAKLPAWHLAGRTCVARVPGADAAVLAIPDIGWANHVGVDGAIGQSAALAVTAAVGVVSALPRGAASATRAPHGTERQLGNKLRAAADLVTDMHLCTRGGGTSQEYR